MTERITDPCVLRAPGRAFPRGYTALARESRKVGPAGFLDLMDFGVHQMASGEVLRVKSPKENAWILMGGSAVVRLEGSPGTRVSRKSLFEEGPSVVHCGAGEAFTLKAGRGGCEWAVARTSNPRAIGARLYKSDAFAGEDRGAGLAQGACRRLVRTVFDYSTRPEANLVVGEVINYPGRWSTYPPHHHPQPEIYHYRFTLPQGYGHSEIGEAVYKVRHGDTAKIPGGLDHSQVSAPGYGMYYLWLIRHLPRRPYRGFKFTGAHTWLLDPARQGWAPKVRLSS